MIVMLFVVICSLISYMCIRQWSSMKNDDKEKRAGIDSMNDKRVIPFKVHE